MTPRSPGRPTRSTTAGRAYLDLQNLARRQERPTSEVHQIYALEGLLERLAISSYGDQLVLKGGVLLAAYDARRPTRDVDVQAHAIAGEPENVLRVVREIASLPLADGLAFDSAGASAEVIRDSDEYQGVRVNLAASLDRARLNVHVDVSTGDPVWPAPETIELPRLLGGTIRVIGYPLSMVLAEKIVTALQRGTANTRWRDFADIYLLSGRNRVDGAQVRASLNTVADYRGIQTTALADALDGFVHVAQQRWLAWRAKQLLDDRLPPAFADVLAAVITFADPVLIDLAFTQQWDPTSRGWY